MRHLRGWIALATVLAFLAGAGLGAILGRLAPATDATASRVADDDVDRYLDTFDRMIGFRDADQRRTVREAYERYWTNIRTLRDEFLQTNRERVERIRESFDERLRNALDEKQLRELDRRTRGSGENGPDRDVGEGAERR